MMRIPTTTIVPVFKLPDTTTTTTAKPIEASHTQKGYTMITAEVPRDPRFELPEGRFAARISEIKRMVKQTGRGPQDWIRILFDVQVPGISEQYDAMAGRNFKLDLNRGSDLRNWLTGLLGPDFFKERAGQKMTLDSLIGINCVVELVHFYGKGYDTPHVQVAKVYPAEPTEAQGA